MSENVYLLHSTEKICLWVGKHSKMDVKKNAMHTAVEFIKKVSSRNWKANIMVTCNVFHTALYS